jgi:hypothetical protein
MKNELMQNLRVKEVWLQQRSAATAAQHKAVTILSSLKADLSRVAENLGADLKEVERQFLLHAPQFPLESLNSPDFLSTKGKMHQILIRRLGNATAYSTDIERHISITKNTILERTLEQAGTLSVRQVGLEQAKVIENQLHYLQCFRNDAVYRIGLFYEDDPWPFAYTSLTAVDRQYHINAIAGALGTQIDDIQVASFSRVYASKTAPTNSISFLISRVMRFLTGEGFDLFITALNPYLFFDGRSLAAANFVPFATCPVAYGYDKLGMYKIRRQHIQDLLPVWSPPPNHIFMKSLNSSHQSKQRTKKIRLIESLVHISEGDHHDIQVRPPSPKNLLKSLSTFRQELEGAWGEVTRYHKTDFNPNTDRISKGQCGVTSAFLASQLELLGHTVLFCEGDVFFPLTDPIIQHCWLVLPAHPGEKTPSENDLIIDITADQSGFDKSVICETVRDIRVKGIEYREKTRTPPSSVGTSHLLSRLEVLQSRVHTARGK